MAEKQSKLVKQKPQNEEVEQVSPEVEESEPEKIASVEKSKRKKKSSKKKKKKKKKAKTSSPAGVTSPEKKRRKKKLRLEEGSLIRDSNAEHLNTTKKQTVEEEESGGGNKLVLKTPTPSPAASDSVNKKRSIDEGNSSREVDTKRFKTEEKTYFKRVWGEEDEIVLLQEIIRFGLKDRSVFYDSVKSKISIEFTETQLNSKIGSLRRKFKRKEKQEVVIFRKHHDQVCFDMSKMIWGSKVEEKEEEGRKKVELGDGGEKCWFEKSFLVSSVASMGLGEEAVKQGWSLVTAERKKKIEDELRLVAAEETRLMLRKTV